MRIRPLVALLALALAPVTGCGVAAGAPADERPSVVTAFYPLRFLTERLAGDRFRISDLTKPGTEPHDVELTARQVGSIVDAEVVVYLKGFQPAVDEAVEQEGGDRGFDAGSATELPAAGDEHGPGDEHAGEDEHAGDEHAGEDEHADEHAEDGHEHAEAAGGRDPHVWLDPERFAMIAEALAGRLAAADPAHAADYHERAEALHEELHELDEAYAEGLADCARREIVTSHEAFHYLAERYDLTETGITGISPETEASPRRLAEVATLARATGTTTIFFETLVSPQVAETIAREVGARTAVLDPIEGLTQPGTDYFSVMRSNLAALEDALGCAS